MEKPPVKLDRCPACNTLCEPDQKICLACHNEILPDVFLAETVPEQSPPVTNVNSFSLITLLGLQVGALIGGSIIIESIFALPGVGRLLIGSIFARDFMIIQGCITFIAVAYVVINFGVDICYALLDPRVRTARSHG